jgi:chromatin remodeling complex protein RSC6
MPSKAAKKATKQTKAVKEASVPVMVEPPKTEVAKVDVQPEEDDRRPEVELAEAFASTLAQVQLQQQQLTALKHQIRALEKQSLRELKAALKQCRKGKRKASNRKPSGFVKPTEISSQLATFLGKPIGTAMARTEVTKEINAYIREHKLQDPENGRHILPNTPLKKLLNLAKTDELTYFNLQRFMSPHFAKGGSAPAAGSTS